MKDIVFLLKTTLVLIVHCTLQAKFGVTVTQDTCLHKVLKLRSVSFFDFDSDASCHLFDEQDYTQQCPVGWIPNIEGWCKPPKTYTVIFFIIKPR